VPGERQHARAGALLTDVLGRLCATQFRHRHVEHRYVRLALFRELHRFSAIRRLSYDSHIRLAVDQERQALTQHRVVVRHKDS
jgi:hypothetical protein